jgi:hypothetical protein
LKLLSAKLEVVLLSLWILFIFSNTKARGEDWKVYYASDSDFYFYDVQSITKFKEVVKVSEKSVARQIKGYNLTEALKEIGEIEKKSHKEMSDESRKKTIDALAVQEIKSLYEINCPRKMYRMITGMEYDKDGTLMDSVISSKWDTVKPDSIIEKLYHAVCR